MQDSLYFIYGSLLMVLGLFKLKISFKPCCLKLHLFITVNLDNFHIPMLVHVEWLLNITFTLTVHTNRIGC